MADNLWTIADSIADAFDLDDIEVSDLRDGSPFLSRLPAEESSNGTEHKYTKETGAPVVGFREPNQGRPLSKSADQLVTITLKILDFSWQVDKAVADAWRQGRERFIAREGMRHLRAAMFATEKQYLGGTTQEKADGFTGFADATELSALAQSMVIDAGGSTADTASSVYLVRMGANDCKGVYKGDSLGSTSLGETIVQKAVDAQGASFPVYYTPACMYLGIQLGSAFSVARIANVTEDSGKGLTDDLIFAAMEEFPAGAPPNLIVCSRRSRKQLRQSRTATNTTGAPAPIPTEVGGVPLVAVEAIGVNEPILA